LPIDRPYPQMEGRLEDARLLFGRGRYIDDLPISPNTLHAAFVRSPHGHARLVGIDKDAALATSGVVAVYTAADLATVLDPFPSIVRGAPEYRAIATDRVRYVGEPVALVLARDRYAAEDGVSAVEVSYKSLQAVTDVDAACQPNSPLLNEELGTNIVWKNQYRYGDPKAAFANADRVVAVDLKFPKYNSTPLETYGIVAEYML
jgi:2-furoyl-CoA dehydrogenase large subunit